MVKFYKHIMQMLNLNKEVKLYNFNTVHTFLLSSISCSNIALNTGDRAVDIKKNQSINACIFWP